MPIEQLFKQVRIGVMGETGGAQMPWESSSLRGDFAFRPGIPAAAGAVQLAAEALKRDREAYLKETEVMIQVALERQRRELEEQAAKTPAPVAAIVPPSSWAYRLRDGRGARFYSPDDAQLAPYVVELDGQLRAGRRLSRMPNFDAGACKGAYLCSTRGQVVGREIVTLGAGRFETIKVVFEQNWQPSGVFVGASFGSRRITVWYSPEAKRAVRVSSRVIHGRYPPMEANFDLELVSAQVANLSATQVAHTGGRK
jgi:hypothetical protein